MVKEQDTEKLCPLNIKQIFVSNVTRLLGIKQVSLTLHGGNVPNKFRPSNPKTNASPKLDF